MVPKILALDFDGVLCDGIQEYFHSSQQVYCHFWPQSTAANLVAHQSAFQQLRPVIEKGWEMPLLLRAIARGITTEKIHNHWLELRLQLLAEENITSQQLSQKLDQVRDQWLQNSLSDWLALHRFYPGVIARLKSLLAEPQPIFVYIVTTKEGRFAELLLKEQGINLDNLRVVGKECQQSKDITLAQIRYRHQCAPEELWFVEDLLKTLIKVSAHPHLEGLKLFLAAWGYNTPALREKARQTPSIHCLSLKQFQEPFKEWLG